MKKNIRKLVVIFSLVLIISIIFKSNFVMAVPAKSDIKILLDNEELMFDQAPIMDNERVLVPLRVIFEKLGADIYWNNGTKTVTAIQGKRVLEITINKETAYINDREVKLDVPAKTLNGRTLVPIRFISESLGAKVDWDEIKETVVISSQDSEDIIPDIGVPIYETYSEEIIKERREAQVEKLRPNIRMINFKIIDKETNEVIAEVTPATISALDEFTTNEKYNQKKVIKGKTYEFQATIVNYPTELLPKATSINGTFLNFIVRLDANIYKDRTTKPNEEHINFVQSFDRPNTIPYLETAHFRWDYTIPENVDYAIRLTPSVNYEHNRSLDNYNTWDDWMDIIVNVTEEENYLNVFQESWKKDLASKFPKEYTLPDYPSGVTNYNNKESLRWLKENFGYRIIDEVGYQRAFYSNLDNNSNYTGFWDPIDMTFGEDYVDMLILDKVVHDEDSKKVLLHTLKYLLGNDYQKIYDKLSNGEFDGKFFLNNRKIIMNYNFELSNFYIFIGHPGAKFDI